MEIDGLEIDVVRKNIKHLYIRVYPPEGKVRIVCPRQLDDDTIRQFAVTKTSWIKQKQAKFKARPLQPTPEYITGESYYFKGERYLLNVIYQHATPKVVINRTHLNLYVRHGSIREQRSQVLTNWYRQQLKAELPRLISKWEPIVGVTINDWGVKKMKTRWGTCNIKARRIWLNLELIKQPQDCLEYVIVHELVHLLERKHNQRFWGYMTKFMPHWQQYQEELNRSRLV